MDSAGTTGNQAVLPSGTLVSRLPASLRPEALLKLGVVAFQLGLLVLVVRAYELESRAFKYVIALSWGGFIVHHLLPMKFRMPMFAALSVAAIGIVFGLSNAAWLVGIGLALIAATHLPVPFAARLGVIGIMVGGLAVLRGGWVDSPWPSVIWPILGSMFMFRMIIYLYDLKHGSAPVGVWQSLSYFFMLPNVCFTLFPVVDYKTFCRSHFNDDEFVIYQKGLRWMLRGVLHLLVYRLIYQNFLIAPDMITDGVDAAGLILTTFLLYLRVSGAFHLIIGMLHLFGFNLPETFHYWLIPHSFTDFWRRINIYWKNFMQKVFFNPAHFRFKRKLGPTGALMAATTVTFVATWALHSYQWFWIRGDVELRWQDSIFWTLLGVLILGNVYWENKHGRARGLGKASIGAAVRLGLQTVATFVVITVLWQMWSSVSYEEFTLTMKPLLTMGFSEAIWVVLFLVGLGTAGAIVGRRPPAPLASGGLKKKAPEGFHKWRSQAIVIASAGVLLLVGYFPGSLAFVPEIAGAVDQLRDAKRLNLVDQRILERGYYEDLTDVQRFSPALADLYKDRPADWDLNRAVRLKPDAYPPYDLHPSVTVRYKGATIVTNRWGFRDRDWEKQKPEGVYRVALLGSSHVAGIGVENEEIFEHLVEERLNREVATGGRKFELMNFAISGYGPYARLANLEQRVFEFSPDMVLMIGIDDIPWVLKDLCHAVKIERRVPYDKVDQVFGKADVDYGMSKVISERRLRPHAEELLSWAYERMVSQIKKHGARPFATFIPRPEKAPGVPAELARQAELAAEAGYTVIDTTDAFDSVKDLSSLWIARWDKHPDARGHRLLADAVYKALLPHLK